MSGIRVSALGALSALAVCCVSMLIPKVAFTAGEAHASTCRGASQTAPAESRSEALVAAYNGCGQQLFQAIADKPRNIVLSPYSIGTAMAMTLVGARGETASEMAKVLGLLFPPEEIDGANGDLLTSLNGASTRSFQLRVANALILPKRGSAISEGYSADLRHNYAAEIFRGATVATVNNWVKEQTAGKIDSILNQVDPLTALVLINAVYFKAPWRSPFNAAATHNEAFHLINGKIAVPTMVVRADFAVAERPGYDAIRLPYAGDRLAMIIMLPKIGVADAVQRFDGDELQHLLVALRAPERPIDVSLPRFHASFSVSLAGPFAEMGMHRAFDTRTVDFSGITGKPQSEVSLAIDQIRHRAVVDVAEEGTEAAAVTGVGVKIISAIPVSTFRVDRPFMFAIVDQKIGAVLFEGQITDPR